MLNSIKAKANAKRTTTERVADFMTARFGSMAFLTFNVLVFFFWIFIHTGQISFIAPFDPFPFSLLTTIVSLEAIILAVFVLISQNRSSKVDDLRDEVQLQVNLIIAKEVTKMLKMTEMLLEKNGIDLSKDPELKKLLKPISEEEIEKKLEEEIL